MKRYLYIAYISGPRQRPESQQGQGRRRVDSSGKLNQDTGQTEPIAVEPGQRRIRGQYVGDRAAMLAAELDGFVESDGFDILPFYAEPDRDPADGWYTVEQLDIGPVRPGSARAFEYGGVLNRAGRRRSHFRALQTEPLQLDHPFGNATDAEIGAPAVADDVQWVNPETEVTETPTPLTTRTTEFGDVVIYDADAATADAPTLVYDIDYRDEHTVDVRLWDDRGFADRADANGARQWQRVFTSTHDYVGQPIVSSGRFRIRFNQANNVAEPEVYTSGSWSAVSLGTSDWRLQSVDIGRRATQDVAPNRVDAVSTWQDTTSSATYTLDITLQRGADSLLMYRTPNSTSPVPSGLQDRLAPIADDAILDPQGTQALRPRSGVRP